MDALYAGVFVGVQLPAPEDGEEAAAADLAAQLAEALPDPTALTEARFGELGRAAPKVGKARVLLPLLLPLLLLLLLLWCFDGVQALASCLCCCRWPRRRACLRLRLTRLSLNAALPRTPAAGGADPRQGARRRPRLARLPGPAVRPEAAAQPAGAGGR